MKRFDFHPEAALELEKQGLLSGAERTELLAHLGECSACAAELWAHHYPLSYTGESEPGDDELNRLAVAGALAALAGLAPARPRWRRAWPLALAAALPLTAVAAVSGWRAAHVAPASAPQASRPGEVPRSSSEPTILPLASAAPSPLNTAPVQPAPSEAPIVPSSSVPARAEPSSAAELFRRAGELKRAGQATPAIEVYRDLQQRFSSSPEAKLSYVVAGGLLLDQGKAAPAIAQFDRYLATSGPASEEALVGRANALQRLGRATDEAQAWRDLLKRFPGSVHARAAQTRLTQLGAEQDSPKQP